MIYGTERLGPAPWHEGRSTQDGESWIGATADTARYLNEYFAPVNGALEPARDFSVAAFRDAVAGRLT